jgi:hypothetical protein
MTTAFLDEWPPAPAANQGSTSSAARGKMLDPMTMS